MQLAWGRHLIHECKVSHFRFQISVPHPVISVGYSVFFCGSLFFISPRFQGTHTCIHKIFFETCLYWMIEIYSLVLNPSSLALALERTLSSHDYLFLKPEVSSFQVSAWLLLLCAVQLLPNVRRCPVLWSGGKLHSTGSLLRQPVVVQDSKHSSCYCGLQGPKPWKF